MINNWVEVNNKRITLFISAITIFLIFNRKIEAILLSIGDSIDYDSASFKIGYISLFFITGLVYTSLIKKKYIPNKNISFTILLVTICYLIIINSSNYTELYPLKENLKYLDILFFILVLHAILLWNNFKGTIERKNTNNFFLQDNLHEGIIDNELILNKLIDETLGFKPKDSFSIGISASWGYGKSTFLNRFKTKYEEKNTKAIIFWYRIWKNKGSHAIIDNFFQELAKNLEPYSGEISNDINQYVKAILHITPGELSSIIDTGKNIFREEESLETYYQKIKNCIKKIDRQIVILLDDLDRLEEDEILDSFKIIRTFSDFNNIIFIAGYDRTYLQNTLGKDKENYINKIFQVEINLLPFDERRIRNLLLNEIESSFPTTKETPANSKLLEAFSQLFNKSKFNDISSIIDMEKTTKECSSRKLNFNHFIKTYRDIKRFVNEFKFNYSFINSEEDVNLEEYILLKLCTFRYRALQNLLFVKLDDFLSKQVLDNVNHKIKDSFGTYSDVYLYDVNAKKKVDKLLERYNEEDKEIINVVLCQLFGSKPFKHYENHQNSISKIYHTNTYVRNNIAGAKYTLSDFKKAFDDCKIEELIEELKLLTSQTSSQIFNEIKTFLLKREIHNKNDFNTLVIGLNSLNSQTLFNDGQKIIDIIKSAYEKIYNKNSQSLIDDLNKILEVNKIGYLDFLLGDININIKRLNRYDLGYNSTNSIKYENVVFTEEEIKNLLISKYQFIVNNSDRIDLAIQGYYLHIEAIIGNRKILKSEEANKIFRNDFDKRFIDYFNHNLFDFKSDFTGTDTKFIKYKPNDFLAQIFSSSKTLAEVIKDPTDRIPRILY